MIVLTTKQLEFLLDLSLCDDYKLHEILRALCETSKRLEEVIR